MKTRAAVLREKCTSIAETAAHGSVVGSRKSTAEKRRESCNGTGSSSNRKKMRLQDAQDRCAAVSADLDDSSFLLALRRLHGDDCGGVVPCREAEIEKIWNYVETCIDERRSGSMYIAGYPGTGKTFTLKQVLLRLSKSYHNVDSIFVNCMNLNSRQALYRHIAGRLNVSANGGLKNVASAVEQEFKSRKRVLLICLDEIDRLTGAKGGITYDAFAWPKLSHRIVVIGVANALDLVERELPKLKVNGGPLPTLVQFAAYTRDEVAEILKFRLKSVVAPGDEKALELCARKVSATTGDIRAALDICKTSLRNSPMRRREDSHAEVAGGSLLGSVAIVQDSLNWQCGPSAKCLPLQQKVMLAAAVRMQQRGQKCFSKFTLYKEYCDVCRKMNVPKVTCSELQHACKLLESSGLFLSGGKVDEITLSLDKNRVRSLIQNDDIVVKLLGNDF